MLLLAAAALPAGAQVAPLTSAQIMESYEGQVVSAIELVGRPGVDFAPLASRLPQHAGEPFSKQAVESCMSLLRGAPEAQAGGKVEDVQIDVRPEPNGIRLRFLLRPAQYFGVFQFPGSGNFSYSRLLQISGYQSQEPYSVYDVEEAQANLLNFFRQTGYFLAEVRPELRPDAQTGVVNVIFQTTLRPRAKVGTVAIEGVSPEETARLERGLRSIMARLRGAYLKNGTTFSMHKMRLATGYLERSLAGDHRLTAKVRLANAEYNPETNRANITFRVTPGPEVRLSTAGAHLWPWTRRNLQPIYQEKQVNDELLEEGRRNLVSYFQSKGYFDAQVKTEIQRQPDSVNAVYQITRGERHKVEDVSVSGNQEFSDQRLVSSVPLHKAGFLSHGKFSQELVRRSVTAVANLYKSVGYGQVKVTPQVVRDNGDVKVNLVVQEGPRDMVESLEVRGNDTVPIEQLLPKGLRLGPGKPYAGQLVQQDRNRIIARYLTLGYLTANFRATAAPIQHDPHRMAVVYGIYEGPKVQIARILTEGREHSRQKLVDRAADLKPGSPLNQAQLLTAESKLYELGPFDWAEVAPRRPVTTQRQEDALIKVHESKRNSVTFGFGFEVINRGGSLPSGTIVVPGIPPVGVPSNFQTAEQTFYGPRGSIQYTRRNLRGNAESFTFAGLAGRLDQRGSLTYSIPHFRGSGWQASATGSGENNEQNPIFNAQTGQAGVQFQKPLDAKRTRNIILRYNFQYTSLSRIVIPGLVPEQDQHYHLSGIGAAYSRDTRDKALDAHRGIYQSLDLSLNTTALGSSVDFARLLAQVAYYKRIGHGIVWANSIRLGLEQSFNNSFVPLSEQFFTGGGSTLRGFSLNGAGPQRPLCLNSGCSSQVLVPIGGNQLFLVNSEFRIPIPVDFPAPIHRNLGLAVFYDGGNSFSEIGFHNLAFFHCGSNVVSSGTTGAAQNCFTSSIGAGLRYNTPVGPVRIDIGHNLNGIPGIKSTQLFITLGQAF